MKTKVLCPVFRASWFCLLVTLALCPRLASGFDILPAGPLFILNWGETNSVLQSTTNLNGGGVWTNVPGGTNSPYYAPETAPQEFFRLLYGVGGPPPLNSPPVVSNLSVSVPHDQFLSVDPVGVLTNSSDPNGLPISAALASSPANGTIALNANGSFNYTPNTGFVGSDSFTFVGEDELFTSAPATVTISVINHAPVAQNDAYAVPAGVTLNVPAPGVLANDSDPDGDQIQAVLVSSPSDGTVTLNPDGSFTYVPNAGFNGMDFFMYQPTDGFTNGNTATVSITVNGSSTPPVASNGTYTVVHDTDLIVPAPGVLALASDAESNFLTPSLGTAPTNGTVTLNVDGSFTYAPNAGFVGTDSFTYAVSDGTNTSAPGTVTINVTATQPTAGDDTYYVQVNGTLTQYAPGVLVNSTSPDGQPLSALLESSPANGTVTLNADGSFVYEPETNFTGTDTFTFVASEGVTNSAPATVTIYVTNQPPIAVNDSYGVHMNVPCSVPAPGVLVNDYDPYSLNLTAALATSPSNGTVTLNSDGSFTYTPNNDFVGMDTFTYTASDGLAESEPATVTLTVHATNSPPVSEPEEFVIRPGDTLDVDPYGSMLLEDSDADGDPLTAQLVTGPAHGTLSFNTNGTFTYVPNGGFYGIDSFIYVPFDGLVGGSPTPVLIIVTNNPPVGQPDQYSVHFNTTLTVNEPGVLENDTDADGDTLVATALTQPSNGALAMSDDGSFTYTPNSNFLGGDSFTYIASDQVSDSAPTTVTISVTDTAPVANDDSYETTKNQSLTVDASDGVLANDYDMDGDTLTAILATGPSSGSLTLNSDGSFTYTPNNGFVGTDSFTYTAFDGLLNSAPATVTIMVNSQVLAARPQPQPQAGPPSLTIYQITFTNGVLVLPDLPGALTYPLSYTPPHFQAAVGGTFNINQNGDRAYPYIYPNNSTMTLWAKFNSKNMPNGTKTVLVSADVKDAKTGNVITTIGGGVKPNAAGVTAWAGNGGTFTTGKTFVKADTAFTGGCTYYQKMQIVWQFSLDNGTTWNNVTGASQNTIYQTLFTPAGPVFETCVWNGCDASRSAGVKSDTRSVLAAMWDQKFVPKGNTRFTGDKLHYYGSWNFPLHIHSIPGLIKTLDGECDTWANYFVGCLLSQGMDIANSTAVQPNGYDGEFMLVTKWSFPPAPNKNRYPWVNFANLVSGVYPFFNNPGGTWQYIWLGQPQFPNPQWTYPPGVPGTDGGQNQPNPTATFNNHWIVRIGDANGGNANQYYDPSYGNNYTDLGNMENKAIDGWYKQNAPNVRFNIRASTKNGGEAPARNDVPQIPGCNLLERCISTRLQFAIGANAYKPNLNGQPVNATLNAGAAPIQAAANGNVTVWIANGYGNMYNKRGVMVRLILGNNPGGPNAKLTMTGNATVTVPTDANGVATFPGLSINTAGAGYTLRAIVVGYRGDYPPASSVSQMFDVN